MHREIRTIRNAQVRAKQNGKLGIEGYGAVFNEIYDNGWFKETIKPGAFARALNEKQDVRCLMNHEANLVLGRTKSATLELKEDQKGLHFSCDLPDTQTGRDLHELIKRGDIDQCSFSFRAMAQTWRDEKDADGKMTTTRELTDVDLYDVGPVTFPAYTATSVGVRSLFPEGVPAEVRSHVPDLSDADGDDDGDKPAEPCRCSCRACYSAECNECEMHMASCADEDYCEHMSERTAQRANAKTGKITKRVDGEDLTAAAFLYVGDPEKTDTWSLPWKFSSDAKTKSHLRNALARFNQTNNIPADKKPGVWKKLVAKCKKYGIQVTDEEAKSWDLDAEQRKQVGSGIDCQCDCPECQVGDCANCSDPDCDDPDCDHPGEDESKSARELMEMRLRLAQAAD